MAMSQNWQGYHSNGRWGSAPLYKLSGVKHTIYHPVLPSLRRMEMDTVGHKLSDEHSRSSTPCTREQFGDFRALSVTERHITNLEIRDNARQIMKRYGIGTMAPLPPGMTQDEWPCFTQAANDWSKYISSSGEFPLRDAKKLSLGYSGYAVRFLKPDVTQSWRYCLQQNPSLDRYGQKPVSVETANTFRSFRSSYSPTTYLHPWH
ncbi:sperm microtubule inner protein 8 isoform 1-T2 [Discoglossus pictus]